MALVLTSFVIFTVDFIHNGGDINLIRDQLSHNDIKTTSLDTNMANTDSQKVLIKMEEQRKKRGAFAPHFLYLKFHHSHN